MYARLQEHTDKNVHARTAEIKEHVDKIKTCAEEDRFHLFYQLSRN